MRRMSGAQGEVSTTITSRTDQLGFVPSLEGLRAAAVLLVLVSHLPVVMLDESPSWWPTGGFLGVDLFFVLSGFLITTLILDEQRRSSSFAVGRFFIRRALRLLPALYLLLACNWVYALLAGLDMQPTYNTTRDAVLYVANWSLHWHGFVVDPRLGHLWSLSLEEQFYVVWAIAMATVIGLRQRRSVAIAIIVVLITAVAAQRLRLLDSGNSVLDLYMRTDTRADGLLIGALLAQTRARWSWRPTKAVMSAATVVATATLAWATWFASAGDEWLYRFGFTAVAGSFAIVVWSAVDGPLRRSRLLSNRVALLIGKVSYGTYLWHLVVFTIVARHRAGWPVGLRVSVALLITVVAVTVSWLAVEQPALRLKDRWGRPKPADLGPADVSSR